MPGALNLPLKDDADITTPATDRAMLFFDIADGEPKYKDDTGAVNSMVGPAGSTRATVTAASAPAGVLTIDYSLGDYFTHTLAANVTSWSFTNMPGAGNGATLGISLTQGATPYTVAWPAAFDWGDGVTPPTMPTGSGDVLDIIITTFNNGTRWMASARIAA